MSPANRRYAAAIGHLAVMAAIVATLWYWPIGIAAAVVLGLFGVPLDELVTFGGALNRFTGMGAWWLIFFAPSLVYAALAFPWEQSHGFPSQSGE